MIFTSLSVSTAVNGNAYSFISGGWAVLGIGKSAHTVAGAGGSTNDDITRNCLLVRNLALSKRGLLHIAFFLILSELE